MMTIAQQLINDFRRNMMYKFGLLVQRGACLAIILSQIGGCAVGPNFVRPAPPDTDRYTHELQSEATIAADDQVQHFSSSNTLIADWWKLFQSTELNAVVNKAIANNPTLQASEASLAASQDNMRAGYGVFFPQIQAGAGASRQRTSSLQQGSQTSGKIFNLVTFSSSVSYAMDVFGGARRSVESLRAQAEYQRYENVAAYLMLSANVVNTSIARAAYYEEICTTKQLIKLEKQQLRLTQAQVNAGTSPYVNVLSIESLIAANQALLAPLEQNLSQAEHLLAMLEGEFPSKADLPDINLYKFSLPIDLPVSLPSDLVNQRPDILAAEAQMHVASAKIGVATALMFPSFSLNGTFGTSGTNFGNLTASSGKFWSIGPVATIPLFQGTTLWFGRKAAIDAYQQSRANYRQTVLSAFEQVADSLKALEHDAEALQAQVEAKRAAGETLKLLQANYRAGLVDYLAVLTADVQYRQNEDCLFAGSITALSGHRRIVCGTWRGLVERPGPDR
jgi:NodT family efflux transporter outer membrane factor (OMF) lipoprotein